MSRSLLSSPSFLMSLLLKSHTSLKISIPSHRPCVSPSSSPVSLSRRSSFLSQFRFLSFFLTPLSLNRSLLLLSRSPFSPPLVNSSSSSLVHISPVTFPASSSLSLFSPPSSSSLPSFFLFKEGPSSSSLAEKSQRREKERKEERDEGNFPPFLKKKKKTSDGNRSLVFFTPSLALRDSPQNKEEEERKISSEDKKKDCIFEERRKKESEESGSFLLSERTTIEDTMEGSAPSSPSYMGGFDPKDRGQAGEVVLVPTLSDNYAYLLIDR
ncbi:hydroxyacylglutathione [Cystoisospora suis]|uniref:Hydroxyacylglutathione n=1 Tax=Cystoisospora suis TaxID=483139 RepID=A0A2C6KJS2_9APIC|nr:hydroxyacylglutathione [Cystoisospora suis]